MTPPFREFGATTRPAAGQPAAAPTTAGSLTNPTGAVTGHSRASVAGSIAAVLLAVVAFVKTPSTHVTDGGENLHMH